jgi:hypothetical protein
VGSGALSGPAIGGETMGVDVVTVTRANTRRNKGKAVPPMDVLARLKDKPASHRMQELKEVHDARVARKGKPQGKTVQWGVNEEIVYEAEDDDDEEKAADEAAEKMKGRPAAKKRASLSAGGKRLKKDAEPNSPRLTKSAGVAGRKAAVQTTAVSPVKTRSSTRRNREGTGS